MPLSARLDNRTIYSFEFNAQQWDELKASHGNLNLTMPCCGHGGTPKTSILGNYFFAHKPNSDCPYACASESRDLSYLKFIIAREAYKKGWSPNIQESWTPPSTIPDGVDVYCTKNNAKLAFQIQLYDYPQAHQWVKKRSKEYHSMGIRPLWLKLLKEDVEQDYDGIYRMHDVPVFGIRNDRRRGFYLPQFSVSVEQFISGVFKRGLTWSSPKQEPLFAKIYPEPINCQSCKDETRVISDITIQNRNGVVIQSLFFGDKVAKELIADNINKMELNLFGVAAPVPRPRSGELTNCCIKCGSLISDHSLEFEPLSNWLQKIRPYIKFEFAHNGKINIPGVWLFEGKASKDRF